MEHDLVLGKESVDSLLLEREREREREGTRAESAVGEARMSKHRPHE
jgi:hypothetical protein